MSLLFSRWRVMPSPCSLVLRQPWRSSISSLSRIPVSAAVSSEACGVGVADEVADAALVQRQGPWGGSRVVGEGDVPGLAAPGLGGADGRDGLLDQRPDGGESGRADPARFPPRGPAR